MEAAIVLGVRTVTPAVIGFGRHAACSAATGRPAARRSPTGRSAARGSVTGGFTADSVLSALDQTEVCSGSWMLHAVSIIGRLRRAHA